MSRGPTPHDIDEYVSGFPPEVQARLEEIRATIHRAVPGATEAISYQIPTFRLHGNLVHFAAFERHIGLYPAPFDDPAFADDIARYGAGKGTLRFPLDAPQPLDLVERVARYWEAQQEAREAARAEAKRTAARPGRSADSRRPSGGA